MNEAAKCLMALAVTALDGRYYGMIRQLAVVMGGANAFAHACTHVHAALLGAERVAGDAVRFDPGRGRFILETVREYLTARGRRLDESGLWFLPTTQPPPETAPEGQPIPEAAPPTLGGAPKKIRRKLGKPARQVRDKEFRPAAGNEAGPGVDEESHAPERDEVKGEVLPRS